MMTVLEALVQEKISRASVPHRRFNRSDDNIDNSDLHSFLSMDTAIASLGEATRGYWMDLRQGST
jgi:hypothetical protein